MTGVNKENRHGMCGTRVYKIWVGMRQRCCNPNYQHWARYGGRGIKVCERWLDFREFYADMGQPPEGLTLERLDPDGDYDAINCAWKTRKVQANNRSTCRQITHQGKTRTLMRWSEATGVPFTTLRNRIVVLGMPLEEALVKDDLRASGKSNRWPAKTENCSFS